MNNSLRKVIIKQGRVAKRFSVKDLEGWVPVAQHLATLIQPGSVVALKGPLGAGKTTLVQYLAQTLGAPKRATSPTFALVRIYDVLRTTYNVQRGGRDRGRGTWDVGRGTIGVSRLVHVDAYRIEDEKDLVALDLDEELLEPGTVVLVEWPENIKNWMADKHAITVEIAN